MNLVVGSSGLLGGMIVQKLLDQGSALRLLVRSESSAFPGADAVRGDLKDRDSLDAACTGVETVITTANSAQRGGDDNVSTVDWAGNFSLIDAAKKAGVGHFVFVSAAGADENSPVPLFAAKARTEQYLRLSGMDWTVIAPHVFMEVWFGLIIGSALQSGRPVPLVGGGRRRHSFISVADVAAFAVASAGNDSAKNRRLVLGGPEALSWTDVVAKTGRHLNRELATEEIAPGSPIPTLPSPVGEVIGGLAAGLEMQDVVIDSTETAQEFGVRLTTAEEVLRRMFQ